MKTSLVDLLKTKALNKLQDSEGYKSYLAEHDIKIEDSSFDNIKEYQEYNKSIVDQLTKALTKGSTLDLSIKDMVSASQYDGIMKEVIQRVVVEEKEPGLFLSEIVADKIPMPTGTSSLLMLESSAFVANEMAPGQEYQLANTSMIEGTFDVRVGKQGIGVVVPDEVRDNRQLDLFGVYLKKCVNAVNRLVESNCFTALSSTPNIVFDPALTGRAPTGIDDAGVANNTFSYVDMIQMCGTLMAQERNATHILSHPLAWSIFATDPFMRATFYTGGMGNSIWDNAPMFEQTMNMPFGLTYVPYQVIDFTFNAGTPSSPHTTDIYAIDAKESIYLAEKDTIMVDEDAEFWRDGRGLKVNRATRAGLKDKGTGVARAKTVAVTQNYAALYTVRNLAI